MTPRGSIRPAVREVLGSERGGEGGMGADGPSRRQVLGGLLASGLAAGTIGSLLAACTDDQSRDGEGTGTSERASGPATGATEAERAIIRVGRRYRAVRPEEDDRQILIDRLGIREGAATSSDLLPTLDQRVTEDFRASRTILIDGWVLSLAEGRAAALVSFD